MGEPGPANVTGARAVKPPGVAGTPGSDTYFSHMQRLLSLLVLALVVLLVAGTVRRSRAAVAQRAPGTARVSVAGAAPPGVGDSARSAARALLVRYTEQTYLDSLLVSTDSLVRRWPDRGGAPVRIALLEGGSPDYGARMAGFVREAASRWEAAGTGWRFGFTGDSASADIVVRWRVGFGNGNQAGVTDLRWTNAGPGPARLRIARHP